MTVDDEQLALLRRLHGELPVGIWVARASNGEEVYANARFAEILGTGLRDASAGGYAEPYGIRTRTGEPYPEDKLPFVRVLQAREQVVVDDIVIHRADGKQVFIRAFARPLFKASDPREVEYVVVAFTDMTLEVEAQRARELSEARAAAAARLESIGKLAGGVAHDFNNILAAVRTTSFLVENEPDPETRRADLELVRTMSDRAAALARSLLRFSGRESVPKQPVDVNKLVEELAPLLKRAVDERIHVTIDGRATRTVHGDASQLEQIVMNLVLNARDAMPQGGALAIRTYEEGAHGDVVIEVQDNGPGIPLHLRDRVFEPYFTTKSTGAREGAGLGLATVYGIAKSHGGRVDVDDAAPGAIVRVRLPASNAPLLCAPATPPPTQRAKRAEARHLILLADDDDVVRFVTERSLKSMGYDVVSAADGEAALALFEQRRADVSAALLDVRMPRLDGLGAFSRLRALAPTLPVLFLTGTLAEDELKSMVAMGADGCLGKPTSPEVLDAELKRAIATR